MRFVDAATGLVLLAVGVVSIRRAPGWLLLAAGVLWFAGDLTSWAVFLHRGPLVHLVVAYPQLRPRRAVGWIAVTAGYVAASLAGFAPFAVSGPITLAVAAVVLLAAVYGYAVASGVERMARRSALVAAVVGGAALSIGSVVRLSALTADDDVVGLLYSVLVVAMVGWLAADLRWGRWAGAVVAGLVVDLGQSGPVRNRLSRALGDPTMVVGFWLASAQVYVDELGRPVPLPGASDGRVVTVLEVAGERVGVLVHDSSVPADRTLIAEVASAARFAMANVALREELRARADEVAVSRAHLVEFAAEARRGLAEDLRHGPERHLERVAELLHGGGTGDEDGVGEALARLDAGLRRARRVMHDLLVGIHPLALTAGGLPAALADLVQLSSVPVTLDVVVVRFPVAVETAAYFVCSEALANIGRHAAASAARIRVWPGRDAGLRLEVADDGVGGARIGAGSGLRGLADRVAALGGALTIDSPLGRGTRVSVELPLPQQR
jgi:signal transduction histidine kinase